MEPRLHGRPTSPIATPPPMVRFSTCVVFSMRSAAALSALATAVWVARARSVAAMRTLRSASSSSSSARMRVVGVEQFVADGQRRHHGEARIADLAELAAQRFDARFQALGEFEQPHFLPFLAGHAVLPAVDGDVDVAHELSPASSTARMVPIAASSFSAISRLVRSSRRVFTSELSSSSASRDRSAPSAWIRLASSFSSRSASRRRSAAALQRVERRHQPPRRGVDIGEAGSGLPAPLAGRSLMRDNAHLSDRPAARQNLRFGKRLDR